MAKDKDGNDIPDPTGGESEDLSPSERKKFGKFLDEFLAEDDATPTPAPTRTPQAPAPASGGGVDIEAAINRALDARTSKTKDDEWRTSIETRLSTMSLPKKRKWWEAWTLFSG
jgi:hypothetical protein